MKYFSMFSGIGGFEYGIQRVFNNEYAHISEKSKSEERSQRGKRSTNKQGILLHNRNRTTALCVGYSEIDKYANQIYQKHFGGKNYGDATKINPKELPDFDLLVGGFPCQAFSIAGKRKGFDDTRGTLFFDIARILAEKKPKHLVLENVKGLLSHDQGRTFQTILGVLADLGYRVEWQVLNSKDFGVPQNRERVIIVGHLGTECSRKIFPITGANSKDIKQLNQPKHSNDRVYSEKGISPTLNTMQGGNRQPFIQRQPLRFLNRNQKNIEGDYAYTVDSSQTSGVKIEQRIRRLTPIECERLQGFPDNWTEGLSDTQRYKTLGNAVTTNVITAVMEVLYG